VIAVAAQPLLEELDELELELLEDELEELLLEELELLEELLDEELEELLLDDEDEELPTQDGAIKLPS
jgi:hypothetical protein